MRGFLSDIQQGDGRRAFPDHLVQIFPSPFPSPQRLPAGRQGEREGVRR